MVDTYGRWTYFSDEPKEKWCDLDRIAHWIEDQGYQPETSMENLVVMIALHLESHLEEMDQAWPEPECIADVLKEFVFMCGTLRDFDYEP